MVTRVVALATAACTLLPPVAAQAYIGPGAGASLAGSLLAGKAAAHGVAAENNLQPTSAGAAA